MNMLCAAKLFHSKKDQNPKILQTTRSCQFKFFQFGVVDLAVYYNFPKFCKIHRFQLILV